MKRLHRLFRHDAAWVAMAVLWTAIVMFVSSCAPYQGNEWLLEMQAQECAVSPLC